MAKGRQRKRDNLLAKKAAEAGLAGLTPQALTSIISDDDNDLDNVSFSTTDGATTTIKNNRNKENQPRKRGFAPLGDTAPALPGSNLGGRKGYMPGSDPLGTPSGSNRGSRKGYTPGNGNFPDTGPNGRGSFRPDDELMLANGSATRSNLGGRKGYMPGNNIPDAGPMGRGSFAPMEDELLLSNGPSVRGSRKPKQAKALTDFVGEDLTGADNQFVTVAMDSQDDLNYQADDSVIGEEINDDGTVTYEFAKDFNDMSVPEVTETEATAAQLEPGMYDNVEAGQERALTPTLDNKGMLEFPEEPIFGRQSDEEKATAAITMEEQLKEQALLRQLQADTVATDGRKGYTPGQDGLNVDDELDGARKGYMPGEDPLGTPGGNNRGSRKGYRPGNGNLPEDDYLADELDQINAINDGTVESLDSAELTDGEDNTANSGTTYPNIHNNEPGTTPPEVVAEETKKAEVDIQAAQAGNPHLEAVTEDAKTEVETLKEEVETGVTTPEAAADKIKNSLGQLGELLGIDGKDLIRGLFRYAGARVFGMSGNEAGRFMYEGFMGDEAAEAKMEAANLENSGLGSDATANQKNLKAYNDYIDNVDTRVASGELTKEEGDKEKRTANQIFGVDKQQRISSYNVKGIRPDGTEDTVLAKNDASGNQLVYDDGQWIPIEQSNLTDVQRTVASANQPFERGVADKRVIAEIDAELAAGNITEEQAIEYKKNASIPNATRIDSKGNPSFAGKFKNETESDSYSYALRMVNAQPAIDVMLQDPEMVEKLSAVMSGIQSWGAMNANDSISAGVINNIFKKENLPQQFRPLTSMWLQGLLRKDTGAAYSGYEYNDYLSGFMPMTGDLPGTIEQKRLQMVQMTRDMAANAGSGSAYLMGRMDGEFRAPDGVQAMVDLATDTVNKNSTKSSSNNADSSRSVELQSALDQY